MGLVMTCSVMLPLAQPDSARNGSILSVACCSFGLMFVGVAAQAAVFDVIEREHCPCQQIPYVILHSSKAVVY